MDTNRQSDPMELIGLKTPKMLPELRKDDSRVVAFYLPQFHRVKENDEWWGPGFTEWTNVSKAKPNFQGHIQPHVPRELGFYNLRYNDVLEQQISLAKAYGIFGFNFYYYWFNGRRILELPLNNFIDSDLNFPFCITWANENWTRTWDGKDSEVLLQQDYNEDFENELINDLKLILLDPRYIKVDGKPLLVIYRAMSLPDPRRTIEQMREAAKKANVGELHISVVDFYDISHPREVGADSLLEFPPHKFNGPENSYSGALEMTNPNFKGSLVDYDKMILQSVRRKEADFLLHRGVVPSWDNTARRQDSPTIVVGSTPSKFQIWLNAIRQLNNLKSQTTEPRLIFVNAWNEWAEGAHLEPDINNGLGNLEAIAKSQWIEDKVSSNEIQKSVLLNLSHQSSSLSHQASLQNYHPTPTLVREISRLLIKIPYLHRLAAELYSFFVRKIKR